MKHQDELQEKNKKIDIAELKPSELLTVALADLVAIENTPGYVVNMGDWHQPRGAGCSVCLAGATMARQVGLAPTIWETPSGLGGSVAEPLLALNCFVWGDVEEGLIHLKQPALVSDRKVGDYDIDRDAWFSDMREIASDLEEAGL